MQVKDASEIRRLDANKPPEAKKAQAAASSSLTSDKVSSDKVSTDSKALLAAAASATQAAAGQNRSLRLEAIEAAVRQGTFKPDPQRIAQEILDDAELSATLQSMLKLGS